MGNLRLFTAVKLPEEIARALGCVCQKKFEGLRWVDERLLHITLKFIGSFPEERLGELTQALGATYRPKGKIILKDWVCFPERGKVRIAGVGVIDEKGELTKTFESIDEIVAKMGVAREGRKYTPHVTVGRAKFPVGGGIREALNERPIGPLEFENNGFVLFSSDLTNSGPIYRVLSSYII